MKYPLALYLFTCLIGLANASEIEYLSEPLKKSYSLPNGNTVSQTEKFATAYSMTCNMGKAIPSPIIKGNYINSPIDGLKLELRALAAILLIDGNIYSTGPVVATKNNDVVVTFKPNENLVSIAWGGSEFDVDVHAGVFNKDGAATINLLTGQGFFYNSIEKSPDYFLSECKRVKKDNVPLYSY